MVQIVNVKYKRVKMSEKGETSIFFMLPRRMKCSELPSVKMSLTDHMNV